MAGSSDSAGRAPVSVIVAARDEEAHLRESIGSLLAVLQGDDEVIVVDDASSDATADVVRAIGSERVRLIVSAVQQGRARSRNLGLQAAQHEFVAVHDADDIALPERIDALVAFLESNPDVVATSGQCITMTPAGRAWRHVMYPTGRGEARAALIRGVMPICHTASLMRKSAVLDAGAYAEEFVRAQDFDLILRMAQLGAVVAAESTGVVYRHPVWLSMSYWREARRYSRLATTGAATLGRWHQLRYVVAMTRRVARFLWTHRAAERQLRQMRALDAS